MLPFFSSIGDVSTFTFVGKRSSDTGTVVIDPTNPDGATRNNQQNTLEGTTVQLPTFNFTTVSTTVSVPDGLTEAALTADSASSMSPTIVVRQGNPFLVLGSPGGRTIINTVLLTIVNVLDHKMPIQDAVNAAGAGGIRLTAMAENPEKPPF